MVSHRCFTRVKTFNISNKPHYCAALFMKGQMPLEDRHLEDEMGYNLQQTLTRQNVKV